MVAEKVIEVGAQRVTITPYLRKQFDGVHARMTRSDPTNPQFSRKEQLEMLKKCEDPDGPQQAGYMLELIHYLRFNGVSVKNIIPELKCRTEPSRMTNSVSGQPVTPRALAFYLHFSDRHEDDSTGPEKTVDSQIGTSSPKAAMPLFIAPDLQVVAT